MLEILERGRGDTVTELVAIQTLLFFQSILSRLWWRSQQQFMRECNSKHKTRSYPLSTQLSQIHQHGRKLRIAWIPALPSRDKALKCLFDIDSSHYISECYSILVSHHACKSSPCL